MDRATVVLVTLVVYKVALLTIGWIAERRTRDEADYLLGGRGLGPLVAAISASASSSSVWTLLGVSGYAFSDGLRALWLFPACVGGFALNWFLIGPRLRPLAAETGALTVTELLAGPGRSRGTLALRWAASAILLFSLTAYVAAQFQGAGKSFASWFELDFATSVVLGSAIVVVYTVLGGFWAVSLTDTLQGLMMAATAVALPIAGLLAVGGFAALADGVAAVDAAGYADPMSAPTGRGVGFAILALLGIGLAYPGQPHVVNRFMALRDDRSLRRARLYAMAWAVVVYAGMLVVGLCARVLSVPVDGDAEAAFFALADQEFPPVVAGIMLAAVLSAIMSTADSQLLVAASAVSHDAGWRPPNERAKLIVSRLVVLAVALVATALALTIDERLFSSVLFAWSVLGAAFGPLLVVRIWLGPVAPVPATVAMLAGAGAAITAYLTPEWKGGVMERVVPIALAAAIAVPAAWLPRRTAER